jgi:hypothetical protein
VDSFVPRKLREFTKKAHRKKKAAEELDDDCMAELIVCGFVLFVVKLSLVWIGFMWLIWIGCLSC